MRALITGGAGFIGSHLAESLIRPAIGFGAGQPVDRTSREHRAPAEPPALHVHDRFGDERIGAQPADRARRRRFPSRGGGRREAGRRTARPHHRDQRARHGDGAQTRPPTRQAGAASLPRPRSTARARSCRSPRMPTSCLARRRRRAGATRRASCSTSSSRSATGRNIRSPVIVVRLFNTVGPRQSADTGWCCRISSSARSRVQPITVHGDGTQTRSFTWVGDVVSAMMALVQEPKAIGEVFNIGNGAEISIRDLA